MYFSIPIAQEEFILTEMILSGRCTAESVPFHHRNVLCGSQITHYSTKSVADKVEFMVNSLLTLSMSHGWANTLLGWSFHEILRVISIFEVDFVWLALLTTPLRHNDSLRFSL
ncbi:CLUMA_CG009623, isoform A [Clunio marinus]|uniref:CLUMA_CG009623, isoform A n=1 Tax=Clunio marinus TaxID=568069 RepID=A0A1J1I8Z6_9DIPT|nr:CLUMA_CG009623, isoform A [Clunio marinus]